MLGSSLPPQVACEWLSQMNVLIRPIKKWLVFSLPPSCPPFSSHLTSNTSSQPWMEGLLGSTQEGVSSVPQHPQAWTRQEHPLRRSPRPGATFSFPELTQSVICPDNLFFEKSVDFSICQFLCVNISILADFKLPRWHHWKQSWGEMSVICSPSQ